jgi:hypothetical protein
VSVVAIAIAIVLFGAGQALTSAGQPAQNADRGPEIFDLTATVPAPDAGAGAITVPLIIQIDRYTREHERITMTDALRYRGGYPGFVRALRDAPAAGHLEAGGRKVVIRWAHQEPSNGGRVISIVTDAPVFFVGAGRPGGKPTAGYEVAVAKLTLDAAGQGTGQIAAAARVKPGGRGAVVIDDYAGTPIPLTVTTRR